jgi:hypothetical protein
MRRTVFSAALLLGVMLLVTACNRGAEVASDVIRADSAGVKVITSTRADTALSWRFDSIGVFVDSLGEPWLFTGLHPSLVLTDRAGRTYVLEREPAIRRFGRNGAYERSAGRKGGGPGEMEFPGALIQQGDSLAVLDRVRSALVRFGPDLEPIDDIPLRDAFARTQRVAFRSGGLWQERYDFDTSGTTVRLRADTTSDESLMSLFSPTPVNRRMLEGCGGRLQYQQPVFFEPEMHWDNEGARILAYTGPNYELRLYEGPRLIAVLRRNLTPTAPTMDDVHRLYPTGLQVRAGGMTCEIPLEKLVEGAQMAATMPFANGVVLLSDGTMWVQRSLRNEPPVLDVFGSDGAYAGTVRGFGLPLGRLPNGELLVPRDEEQSGGVIIIRMRVSR